MRRGAGEREIFFCDPGRCISGGNFKCYPGFRKTYSSRSVEGRHVWRRSATTLGVIFFVRPGWGCAAKKSASLLDVDGIKTWRGVLYGGSLFLCVGYRIYEVRIGQ